MRIQDSPPIHLTYCLNVHPGRSWADHFAAIENYALAVRRQIAPGQAFGLGMRLGHEEAIELAQPQALEEFRQFLGRQNLYVFTINGFPYGQFHDTAVKENVYRPDWTSPQRRDYTMLLGDLLAALLPEGVSGSISTVPGSYKTWIAGDEQIDSMARMLCEVAEHLGRIFDRTGKSICLALEPEPDCYLETTDEVVSFFAGPLRRFGVRHLVARGNTPARAEQLIQRHLGACLDTAHAAVEFEDLPDSLRKLRQAGIPVAKVQISSALSLSPTPAARGQLGAFCDAVYLHQVKAKSDAGRLIAYSDLPAALASAAGPRGQEGPWRVHFHVPLYFEAMGELQSTSGLLKGEFARLLKAGASEHLEIETYTFAVLPPALRTRPVTESIIDEYRWVMGQLLA